MKAPANSIYIVMHGMGEYDEAREWPVAWYPDEAAAAAYCARFNGLLEPARRSVLYDEEEAYWRQHPAELAELSKLWGLTLSTAYAMQVHNASIVAVPQGT